MDQLGSYRLRKRLAVGGMGEVYLGEKIGPEGFVKPVVIKCVLPQLAKDHAFVQLFLDEARLAALLNHPNIAQVYDFGVADDVYYIAMEYVPGYTVDDLRRKLKSIGQFMPLQHIACIASQVCQGLHYAHTLTDARGVSLGLVHRDVSPHNLIVSIDGGVKIVDFGIAKARAGLTRVQAKGAVGKYGYMSPEQSRGEVVDGRSDAFSLGICLWELITNERLHDPNLDRAPNYTPSRPVASVELHRTEVPRQFQQILESALSIQPEDRFNTLQEMHLALERFQAAMTHYAGQAALAAYIKELVDGKLEHKESGPTDARYERRSGEGMDAAQRYEEVFGVSMPSKRPKPTVRAVPQSWQTTEPPPPETPLPPKPGPRLVEMREPPAEPLALAEASRRTRAASLPTPRPEKAKVPWFALISITVAGALAGGAFLYRDQLVAFAESRLQPPPPPPGPKLNSIYRVETDPPGAQVFVDGQLHDGLTPLDLELIPDVEHRIVVKLAKYATKAAVVKASIGTEIRRMPFQMEPAASLQVSSSPAGASVTIEGFTLDPQIAPFTLDDVPANRTLKVRAELGQHGPQQKTVEISAGKLKKLRFEFDTPE